MQDSLWAAPTAPWSLQIRTYLLPGSPGPLRSWRCRAERASPCGPPRGPTRGKRGKGSHELVSLAGRQRGEGLPGGRGHTVSRWPSLGGGADTRAASTSAEEGERGQTHHGIWGHDPQPRILDPGPWCERSARARGAARRMGSDTGGVRRDYRRVQGASC
jgi:hypothetical protein